MFSKRRKQTTQWRSVTCQKKEIPHPRRCGNMKPRLTCWRDVLKCVHICNYKSELAFGFIPETSTELWAETCEMFASFGVSGIEHPKGSYRCKVQSHVPITGQVDIVKWLAGIMTASHHSFSHGAGSSHTFWRTRRKPTYTLFIRKVLMSSGCTNSYLVFRR